MKNPINLILALGLAVALAGCTSTSRRGTDVARNLGTNSIFAKLRAMDNDGVTYSYHDLHGNAVQPLVQLMIGRFENTRALCEELDSGDSKRLKKYRAALFRVLGTVQDPSSIPWLKQQLRTNRNEIAEFWLPVWRTYGLRGAEREVLPWLTGSEDWSKFFFEWAEQESDQATRSRIIQVIHSWFHSGDVLKFFRSLEENPKTADNDYLIAELYLFQHGTHGDHARFQMAIDRLAKKRSNNDLLKAVAEEMCDASFIPWLLKVVEEHPTEEYSNFQWLLERITFRRDIWGQLAWKAWASVHLREGRDLWRKRATAELIVLAKTNPSAAREFLDKAVYRWKSPDTLESMQELINYKVLHEGIVGWINLTYAHYHHIPDLRERLKALALRIESESGSSLQPWAKRLMEQWDFLHPTVQTWKDFVISSNMRV